MQYYLKNNVFEESLNRIRFLFDEFEEVAVTFSGGKDSTIVLNLAIQVAREKNRLPIKLIFIDQEAEWDMNIDFIRTQMNRIEVTPMWFQMPLVIFNATSTNEKWLKCWDDEKPDCWIREKEHYSIKENIYGTDRFAELFSAIYKHHFHGKSLAVLGGVRCEESPARRRGLTTYATYKWITWGRKGDFKSEQHYTFYPIYDWSLTDVWKAIHDNKWEYCKIYDYFYQYGIQIRDMRVSNVHHETAIKSLYIMQEIEKENYERISNRISGISTANQLKDLGFKLNKLPFMFNSFTEYRDFLLEKLITRSEDKNEFMKYVNHKRESIFMENKLIYEEYIKTFINAILKNDYHSTTIDNFLKRYDVATYWKYKTGNKLNRQEVNNMVNLNKFYKYECNRVDKN